MYKHCFQCKWADKGIFSDTRNYCTALPPSGESERVVDDCRLACSLFEPRGTDIKDGWICPVCGSDQVVTDGDFPELWVDNSMVTFPCQCTECLSEFTIVCDLKYMKTINITEGKKEEQDEKETS